MTSSRGGAWRGGSDGGGVRRPTALLVQPIGTCGVASSMVNSQIASEARKGGGRPARAKNQGLALLGWSFFLKSVIGPEWVN